MTKRGRPPVFGTKVQRKSVARLLKTYGLGGTENILKARNSGRGRLSQDEQELAEIRRSAGFAEPIPTICKPTLTKVAKAEHVTFERGRPRKAA
jgi:hypothetical protein